MTLGSYYELVQELRAATSVGQVRLVGIDGLGGSGKTTFASRLATAASDAWPVVHTDDFASHDEPLEWWPRMLAQVVEPLLRGDRAEFRAYDWVQRLPGPTVVVEPAEVVIIEGVGATRSAWRDRLVCRIWVDAPRNVRLRRGIERDGEELREFWNDWMKAEDRYIAEEDPWSHADLVVEGNPSPPHGDDVFAVVSDRRSAARPPAAR
jgi:uridine kinase